MLQYKHYEILSGKLLMRGYIFFSAAVLSTRTEEHGYY